MISRSGGEDFERLVELLARVFAGHDDADARLAFGDGWESDASSHQAMLEQRAREVHGLAAIAQDDGDDGRLGGRGRAAADVEAGVLKLLLEVGGVVPQALDAFGLVLEDVECCDTGGGDRWRVRRAEQEGACAMVEEVDEISRSADITAERADGLRERTDLHVDLAVDIKVIDGAAAVAAENA